MARKFAKLCIIKCNEANLDNPESGPLLNAPNVMEAGIAAAYSLPTDGTVGGEMDSRSRRLKRVSVNQHLTLYDSWLIILIHMTTCCRKAPEISVLHSGLEIA